MGNLPDIASAALAANTGIRERIRSAGPQGQYKAVGTALADVVASKAGVSRHAATWALVNAASRTSVASTEKVNTRF